MSNPFRDYTAAQIEAHNARVAGRKPHKPGDCAFTETDLDPQPVTVKLKPTTVEDALNRTEKRYLEYLRRGPYLWIGIQNITLKLANDCRLTPDFTVIKGGKITFIDVKGFQREDALIKMKMAARLFRWADFEIVKAETGGWSTEYAKP